MFSWCFVSGKNKKEAKKMAAKAALAPMGIIYNDDV
jgi:dsRNA-specific ribonuclease